MLGRPVTEAQRGEAPPGPRERGHVLARQLRYKVLHTPPGSSAAPTSLARVLGDILLSDILLSASFSDAGRERSRIATGTPPITSHNGHRYVHGPSRRGWRRLVGPLQAQVQQPPPQHPPPAGSAPPDIGSSAPLPRAISDGSRAESSAPQVQVTGASASVVGRSSSNVSPHVRQRYS